MAVVQEVSSQNMVSNKTLLWNMKMLTSFHHTSALEVCY